MNKRTKVWLRRGLSALLFIVLLYFFLPLLGEIKAAAALFRTASWIWFGIAILVQIASYACLTWLNSLALQPFQGKIAFTRLAAVLTSMAFIQVAVPSLGISGVALRVHLLRRSGYRPEDSLASLVVETLGEVIAITTLVLFGVAFVIGSGVSAMSQVLRYFLFLLILLLPAGYLWHVIVDPHRTHTHLVYLAALWDRFGGRWGKLNVAAAEARVDEFRCNMRNYRQVPFWKLGLSSYGKVILDVATLGAAFYMFGYPISLSDLMIGYGLILLFSGSAALPGGMLMTEASVPVIFSWLGVPGSVALAAGLVYRLIAFWMVRFIGYFTWHALEFEEPAFDERSGKSKTCTDFTE
jgi:glycosyltransferase 2 family protein